jgi:hypothetical protein
VCEASEEVCYGRLNEERRAANVRTGDGIADSFPLIVLASNRGTVLIIGVGGYQVIGGR